MRFLPTLLFVCLFALGSVRAAEFSYVGPNNFPVDGQMIDTSLACTHRMQGVIENGDLTKLVALIDDVRGEWIGARQLCLNSPGGSLPEALRISAYLRDNRIGTKLEAGSACESACSIVFLAGSHQIFEGDLARWRVMHPTARLGVHAPALQVPEADYSAGQVKQAYSVALESIAGMVSELIARQSFQSLGMEPSLLVTMLKTPTDDMHYVDTVDEAGRWKIAVGPVPIPPAPTDADFGRLCAVLSQWFADATALRNDGLPIYAGYQNRNTDQFGNTIITVTLDELSGAGCVINLRDAGENNPAYWGVTLPDGRTVLADPLGFFPMDALLSGLPTPPPPQSSQASGSTEIRTVTIEEVPGLGDYLMAEYELSSPLDDHAKVQIADLDRPADGVDEIVVTIDTLAWCGTGGCAHDILRREPDGALTSIEKPFGFDLTFKDDYIVNARRLTIKSGDFTVNVQLTDLTSGAVNGGATVDTAADVDSSGCKDGLAWSEGVQNGVAGAEVRRCADQSQVFAVTCEGSHGQISFEVTRGERHPGSSLTALFTVDGAGFPIKGNLDDDRFVAPVQADVIAALRAGKSAEIFAADSSLAFHLTGSSRALEALPQACLGS